MDFVKVCEVLVMGVWASYSTREKGEKMTLQQEKNVICMIGLQGKRNRVWETVF